MTGTVFRRGAPLFKAAPLLAIILLGMASGYGYLIYCPSIIILMLSFIIMDKRDAAGKKILKVLLETYG